MTKRSSVLEEIEAKALANFDILLEVWKIPYCKVNEDEYDFLSPTRKDVNFGACRFNTKKGLGADFAGFNYTREDFARLGPGFDKSDFATSAPGTNTNWGFNIVGLCQRVYNSPSYADAAYLLRLQLGQLEKHPSYVKTDQAYIKHRKERREAEVHQKIAIASRTWNRCQKVVGTVGEKYLKARGIFLTGEEPNVRFHPLIMNNELGRPLPTLLLKVQTAPDAPICAIHRIFLQSDGSGKASVANPKMALGSIKGAGIWLGTPNTRLSIVEGPENALSILAMGASFVVCTVNAANFSCLSIPPYVKEVVLLPDNDEAGRLACVRATESYRNQGKTIKVKFPPIPRGQKKGDWNDLLMLP